MGKKQHSEAVQKGAKKIHLRQRRKRKRGKKNTSGFATPLIISNQYKPSIATKNQSRTELSKSSEKGQKRERKGAKIHTAKL